MAHRRKVERTVKLTCNIPLACPVLPIGLQALFAPAYGFVVVVRLPITQNHLDGNVNPGKVGGGKMLLRPGNPLVRLREFLLYPYVYAVTQNGRP